MKDTLLIMSSILMLAMPVSVKSAAGIQEMAKDWYEFCRNQGLSLEINSTELIVAGDCMEQNTRIFKSKLHDDTPFLSFCDYVISSNNCTKSLNDRVTIECNPKEHAYVLMKINHYKDEMFISACEFSPEFVWKSIFYHDTSCFHSLKPNFNECLVTSTGLTTIDDNPHKLIPTPVKKICKQFEAFHACLKTIDMDKQDTCSIGDRNTILSVITALQNFLRNSCSVDKISEFTDFHQEL